MNRALPFLVSFALSACAQPPTEVWGLTDFQNDDLSLVLRTLARQGHLKLIIPRKLTGAVTLRIANKTPREIIDLIAASKNLALTEHDGILYVRAKCSASTPRLPPK